MTLKNRKGGGKKEKDASVWYHLGTNIIIWRRKERNNNNGDSNEREGGEIRRLLEVHTYPEPEKGG